ncbi:hypothetical protein BD309DRAFT_721495 [Dichomitus squalens]|uniref:Uncharacterized protein n=1 Tax=Dichomitus squalens TaxID=114155 RepID=A0A4Q9P9Q9_9APHY|nr:hypothetical protein BD309DRAFT_721495 [Dichomitus squalens]TBU55327.1 hypothetical protein BD310DRAFT_692896 [Dichomitus squalens]
MWTQRTAESCIDVSLAGPRPRAHGIALVNVICRRLVRSCQHLDALNKPGSPERTRSNEESAGRNASSPLSSKTRSSIRPPGVPPCSCCNPVHSHADERIPTTMCSEHMPCSLEASVSWSSSMSWPSGSCELRTT